MVQGYGFKQVGILSAIAMLTACAAAPTQEMSDARQAVQAAREAGAMEQAPAAMGSAEQGLTDAEQGLSSRNFDSARDEAVAAKAAAMRARNMTMAINLARESMAEAERMGVLSPEARDLLAQAEAAAAQDNEDEVVRITQLATQQAQDDVARSQETQQRAEQENQAWLDKVPSLLAEARQADARLNAAQRDALQRADALYQQQQGRQAYDLAATVVTDVRALPPVSRTLQYKVKKGDRLYQIAARPDVYGNRSWWPLIYRSNQVHIPNPDALEPGLVLVIEMDPSAELIKLATEHARRREGTAERVKKLDKQFLKDAR